MRLLESGTSAVYLAEADGRTFKAIVVLGQNATEIEADSIVIGDGVIGDLAARQAAEFVNDVWNAVSAPAANLNGCVMPEFGSG